MRSASSAFLCLNFMRYYIFFVCFLVLSLDVSGQYKFTSTRYIDNDSIHYTEFPYNLVSYKCVNGVLRVYKSIGRQKLVIFDLSPTSFLIRRVDTIPDFEEAKVGDVLPLSNSDVVISSGRIMLYNRTSKECRHYRYVFGNVKDFREVNRINDSLILLSEFGNLHPLDGVPGLNLHIFNVNTFEIVRSRSVRVPGVALAQLGISAITAIKGNIYFVSPLTKVLHCYNLNLDRVYLRSLVTDNQDDNIAYEHEMDSLVYTTWDRTYSSFMENYGNVTDSLKNKLQSRVYSGQFVGEMSKKVRKSFDFVEKVFPYDDNTLLVAIANRSSNPYLLRDMLFYDIRSGKIKKIIHDWRNGRPLYCSTIEDYFPACVSNNRTIDISFFNGKIYTAGFYTPDAFVPATKDSLDRIMYRINKKSGFKWKLLEYQLN
jgi:hypothetical protein